MSLRLLALAAIVELICGFTGLSQTFPPAAQRAYLTPSNAGPEQAFGASVAVSGDTIVVGTTGQDFGTGAAYVFVRSGTDWAVQAYLSPSTASLPIQFGTSVAISGDTIVVGAPQAPGAAYVFVRSGTTWTQEAVLSPYSCTACLFGSSVAIDGDTIVVGAPYDSGIGTGVNGDPTQSFFYSASGAAYIFARNGIDWAQQAYLKASNNYTYEFFGASISVRGDTVVVGEPGLSHQNLLPPACGVFIYTRTGTTWALQQSFIDENAGDAFGTSVAISVDTLAAGAPYSGYNHASGSAGVVAVATRQEHVWMPQAYLLNPLVYPQLNNVFADAIALRGNTLIVAAPMEDAGAVGYLYARDGATWILAQAFTPLNGQAFASIAVDGNILVAGVPAENGYEGAALVYQLSTPSFVPITVNSVPSGVTFAFSGNGCLGGSWATPATIPAMAGAECTLTVPSQVNLAGTPFAFGNWTDGSTNPALTGEVPSAPATVTAYFTEQ